MTTVPRWFNKNTSDTFKTPWAVPRCCATCIVLILLISTGVSFGAASDEGFPRSPPLLSGHQSGSSAQLHTATLSSSNNSPNPNALDAKNDFTRFTGTPHGAPATGIPSAKRPAQKHVDRERAFRKLARDINFANRYPDWRTAERERAFRTLVHDLNSANKQTQAEGISQLPASAVDVQQSPASKKDVLQRLAFLPLAPPDELEKVSPASANSARAVAPANPQKGETGEHEERNSAVTEVAFVPAPTEAAPNISVGSEQNAGKEHRSVTRPVPATTLHVQTATPALQGKNPVSDASGKEEVDAKTENKTNAAEKRQRPRKPKEAPGDVEGEDKTRAGRDRKDGAAGPENGVNRQVGEKKDGEAEVASRLGKVTALPDIKAKKHAASREGKHGDDVKANIDKRPEEQKRPAGGEGKGRNGPVHAVPRAQQKEAEKKNPDRLSGANFIPPLPLRKKVSPATKAPPMWPAIPRNSLLGDSLVRLRRRSQILRDRVAHVKEVQKWKDECRSKGWRMCGKGHRRAARNGIPRYVDDEGNSSDTDGYTKAWMNPPFPRPLPRTSYTTASASLHAEPSLQETPKQPSGQEATRLNQYFAQRHGLSAALFNGNVPFPLQTAGNNENFRPADALGAALFNGNLPYPLQTAGNNEDPGTAGARLQISALAPFGVWNSVPGQGILPYPYPPLGERPNMDFTEFPFSRGPFSIPSSTSTMSGVFGGVRKNIRPLPPMLLDSSESLARYAEPRERTDGRTPTDTGFWAWKNTSAFPLLFTNSAEGGLSTVNITEKEHSANTRSVRDEEMSQKEKDLIKNHQTSTPGHEDTARATQTGERKQPEEYAKTARSGRYTRTKNRTRKKKPTIKTQKAVLAREQKSRNKRLRKRTRAHGGLAGGVGGQAHPDQHAKDGSPVAEGEGSKPEKGHVRTHNGDQPAGAVMSVLPRGEKLKRNATRRNKRKSLKKPNVQQRRVPVILPAKEELVVDEKARLQVGRRAERVRRKPLIERSSTECLNVISEILTPGTTVTFEPRPDVPKDERFSPMSLVWGTPLGAGANGIVYEVSTRNKKGKKVRYALKMALNRHQSVCNAWTREKRGELTPAERVKFAQDVQRVCFAEYETEMKQRRLLSLPTPSPSTVCHKDDVGKLFAEKQVCVPLAVGRIRGLPDYMVCPGGNVAVVNVAGLTPAASCNLYQILAAFDLTVPEKYELTRQVITAVSRVHSLGLLHKDLKSENLVVTSKGEVIVADLAGAEPLVHGEAGPGEEFDPGTVTFVAPERAAARLGRPGAPAAITVKANAWSLGMIIYEIWCRGIDPFHLETLTDEEVLVRLGNMLRRRYPLSFSSCPPVPRTAQRLISSLLQPDPRRRKTPAHLMWTLPLLRKAEFLNRVVAPLQRNKLR